MILNFSIFDDFMGNQSEKMKLTSEIDLISYVSAKKILEKDLMTKYELFGIIDVEGENLQDLEYSSIVRRFDKETEKLYWVKFNESNKESVSANVALYESHP